MPAHSLITLSLLDQWWARILNLGPATLEINSPALFNLHGCDSKLGLVPLPSLKLSDPLPSEIFSRTPAFKNLQPEDISYLRHSLMTDPGNQKLTAWAETLLRYTEINLVTMMKRTRSQFGSISIARQALFELTAFFLDVYFIKSDLRFLNNSLKLLDIPGLISIRSISAQLAHPGLALPAALYQVRVLLLRSVALQSLETEMCS